MGEDTSEHQTKIFHILVLRGKLRSTVQWITNRYKDCILQAGDICPKTGKTVLKVLRLKHPGAYPLTVGIFEVYKGKPPSFLPMDITNKTVASVA